MLRGWLRSSLWGVKVMEFYDIKLDPSTNKIIVGKNYSSFELYAYN